MFAKDIAPQWFKPVEEDASEYYIKPMDGVQYQNVLSRIDHNLNGITGDLCLEILGYSLLDWRNMPDGVEFDRKLIRKLDSVHLTEVAYRIFNISTLDEADPKN